MYIKPIAGTKVLYFGVTRDKISTFVMKIPLIYHRYLSNVKPRVCIGYRRVSDSSEAGGYPLPKTN